MRKQTHAKSESLFNSILRAGVFWTLQPAFIAISLYLAHTGASIDAHTLFIAGAFCFITLLEVVIPARSSWRKNIGENAALLGFVFVAAVSYVAVETLYEASLFRWMENFSQAWQLDPSPPTPLHTHAGENRASHFCGAFFVSGVDTEYSQAVWANSIGEHLAHTRTECRLRTAGGRFLQEGTRIGPQSKSNRASRNRRRGGA